jgi:methylated-DNA-[protein]-cysteine S-methyltransferase
MVKKDRTEREKEIYSTYYSSPIGSLMIASDGDNIIGLWMEGQKYFANTLTETITEKDDLEIFDTANKWLDKYFSL